MNGTGDDLVTISFKAPPAFAEILSRVAFDLEKSKSEIIRACIELGLPTVKCKPHLVKILNTDPKTCKGYFLESE